MTRSLAMFVPGVPAPGGSKKGFVNPKTGRVVIQDDAKRNGPWRSVVALAGHQARANAPMLAGPLVAEVTFWMPRPKSHRKADGTLKPKFVEALPVTRPDATKLWRAAEDALSGVWWEDDNAIVTQQISKRFAWGARGPGMWIKVSEVTKDNTGA